MQIIVVLVLRRLMKTFKNKTKKNNNFQTKKLFNISKYIEFGDGKRCILLYAHMDQGHM